MGRSYVVFGGPEVGSGGRNSIFLVSMAPMALNWMAKTIGDYSGDSVSAAGDINGDGYADLLIGAYGYRR